MTFQPSTQTFVLSKYQLEDTCPIPLASPLTQDSLGNALVPIAWDVITSSSYLDETNNTYEPRNIADHNKNTSWAEGVPGDGIKEWVSFQNNEDQLIYEIDVINGYGKSEDLYYKNNRVKKLGFLFDSEYIVFELEDNTLLPQTITFSNGISSAHVRATILDVYPGNKYNDTCISEMIFYQP